MRDKWLIAFIILLAFTLIVSNYLYLQSPKDLEVFSEKQATIFAQETTKSNQKELYQKKEFFTDMINSLKELMKESDDKELDIEITPSQTDIELSQNTQPTTTNESNQSKTNKETKNETANNENEITTDEKLNVDEKEEIPKNLPKLEFTQVLLKDSEKEHVVPMMNGVIHEVKAGNSELNIEIKSEIKPTIKVTIFDVSANEIVWESSDKSDSIPIQLHGENYEYYFRIKAYYEDFEIGEYEFLAEVYTEGEFADLIDENDDYAKGYLLNHNYFQNLGYEKVKFGEAYSSETGMWKNEIKGYQIGSFNYAFHLVACDMRQKHCLYRINGADHIVKEGDSINLGDYNVNINSIKLEVCDLDPCDLMYDTYDQVEFVVERGGLG